MKALIIKQRNLIFDKNEEIIEHIILENKNIVLKTEKIFLYLKTIST